MNSFAIVAGPAGDITIKVVGDWSIQQSQPADAILDRLNRQKPTVRSLSIDASELGKWDSALLSFLYGIVSFCARNKIAFSPASLPENARRLIDLATAGPERKGGEGAGSTRNPFRKIGEATIRKVRAFREPITFIGESAITFIRFCAGRTHYRTADLFVLIQECGAEALPIVGIIAFLIGMIFAFVGAIQLKQFGADIYVANLVAVAMFREMGAVMTGIVLAGRTGAAFAAQIAAMQGNEEIDALSTLGISAMEFLVLPRMLALIIMMPLLCLYANALGLIGGYVVGMSTLNVTSTAYLLQTQSAVTLTDLSIGLVKSGVFGVLIAITGCLRGIQAGRSAADVGAAATSAVVSGILAIIITDAIFSVLLNILGL